jgi:hypothetical protein
MDLLSGPWDQTVVRVLLKLCTASVQARRQERKKDHHLRKPFLAVTGLYKNENNTKICFRKELDLSVLPSRDRFLANPFASLKTKINKQTNKKSIEPRAPCNYEEIEDDGNGQERLFPFELSATKDVMYHHGANDPALFIFLGKHLHIDPFFLSSTEINSHLVFFDKQQQHRLLLLLLIIHLPSIANKQNKHHVCLCVKADAAWRGPTCVPRWESALAVLKTDPPYPTTSTPFHYFPEKPTAWPPPPIRSYNLVKSTHTLPSSPAAAVPASSLPKTKPSKNSTRRHKKLAQSKAKPST